MQSRFLLTCIAGLPAVLFLAEPASAYYSASKGRFISRDPIEELPHTSCGQPSMGGVRAKELNLYEFVQNDPINKGDALGKLTIELRRTTPVGPMSCGSFAVELKFKLSKNHHCKGYIVQKVEADAQCVPCSKQEPLLTQVPARVVYWEAWRTHKRGNEKDFISPGDPLPDYYGHYNQRGEVRYYNSKEAIEEIESWGKGGAQVFPRCQQWSINAGTLLVTQGRPPLFSYSSLIGGAPLSPPRFWDTDPVEGSAYRSASSSWSCCPGTQWWTTVSTNPDS